jgi:hypothetical protein
MMEDPTIRKRSLAHHLPMSHRSPHAAVAHRRPEMLGARWRTWGPRSKNGLVELRRANLPPSFARSR